MAERSAKLAAAQAVRRRKLDRRRQELATTHAAERMSLHAAHKAEAAKPFARAAGAIFGLLNRVPGLRSVIAPLRRNPHLHPQERQRIEREALDRRHERERFGLDRRNKALAWIEARERLSLEFSVRRQLYETEAARERKVETVQDQIEVNKLDIVLPHGEFQKAGKKHESGWKGRQKTLGARSAQKQNGPRGYRSTRNDP
jgi:hypothetical protein